MEMTVDQMMQQAKLALNESKLEEAKFLFQNILQAQPTHYKAHNNLGSIFLKLGRLDEAEVSFKKAIEYKPEFEVAHNNLGIALEKLGRYDEAETSYKKAIEYKPDYFEAHKNLNIVLRQNKLLLKIEQVRNSKKKIKVSNLGADIGLAINPFISKRKADSELIAELYKINSVELDKTKDVRYGNGRCSDYDLFENNSSIIQTVKKDLTYIMSQAVKSDIYIIESFFNILRSGSGLTSHKHIKDFDKANGLINQKYSLTYYLSVGDQNCSEPGILKVYDPDEEILPSEGTIVIFPADRSHSIAYGGKIDRVMIGVNFYSLI